ncbi:transcriptional regulator with XRE-family HTH domain [Hoeflea marina]|uniref:Transcriptional regulator with XRE-family HTH domain n=1 Tax=Hoeflea marina TaxID=274592 RepID=A0A317PQ78_9HYPH|nr:helix-turn-helix domain-containing protein [Hoeflea marina]PWW03631.1 transcriptional regulator with XRE-family HTH domain [Hoeflea marina]
MAFGESSAQHGGITLGSRISQARKRAGLSREAAASRAGVTSETLAEWESDRSEPRANKLLTLAGVMGVSPAWLISGNGETPKQTETSSEWLEFSELREFVIEPSIMDAGQKLKEWHGEGYRYARFMVLGLHILLGSLAGIFSIYLYRASYQMSELPTISVPDAVAASPVLFWATLSAGILGVVLWTAMTRQKSANVFRIASLKLELAEMALRSDQRTRALDQ